MYSPKQPLGTEKIKDVADWAYDEFKEVEKGFKDLDRIRMATAFVEPLKKRDGDIVYADGTEWDPGDGEGIYAYFGGQWNKMHNTAVGTITGNVGATDNRLVRSSGTSGTVLDSTGITVDDSNNLSGVGTVSLTSVDLGANTDTTLARASAGDASIEGNIVYRAGGTDVPVTDGGTGASSATSARSNLAVGTALLASGTGSGASLDLALTAYTAYRGLVIYLTALPANDGVDLYCRFSTDGGANYDSGASDYNFAMVAIRDDATAVGTGINATTRIQLSLGTANNQIGNATTEGWHGRVEILRQTSTAFWSRINFQGYYISNAATPVALSVSGGGAREAAQDTDGIQFLMSGGNITWDYAIYGLH